MKMLRAGLLNETSGGSVAFKKELINRLRADVERRPFLRWVILLLPVYGIFITITESSTIVRIVFGLLTILYAVIAWAVLRKR